MDNIVVADKQSEVATQSAWGNINLKGPGVVQMPVSPDKVATVTQRGQDLIVTLKSGEKVTIGNFFAVDQAGVGSDIVFVGEDGTCGTPSMTRQRSPVSPSRTWLRWTNWLQGSAPPVAPCRPSRLPGSACSVSGCGGCGQSQRWRQQRWLGP
jgi:hypothetical protein